MYFKNFPQTLYNFGDAEPFVRFQLLNTYVNLIDQFRDDVTVYEKYTIQPGERADTLSFRLYGTTDYYWTFFMANEKLRESGWPLDRSRIYEAAQKNYPHRAITTATNISDTNFKKGQVVTGSQSGSTGPVVEVKLDLGIIIVNANGNFNDGETLSVGTGGDIQTCLITSEVAQYDSIHHYENSDNEHVDIDPLNPNTSGLVPITYAERLINFNDDLSQISIINPRIIEQVVGQFNKELKA